MCKEIREEQNIRTNLSNLRKCIKEGQKTKQLREEIASNEELWLSFLKSEDAKTRKNAALLFGDLNYERAKDALWEAYLLEKTMFVKSAYLTALYPMDVRDKLPQMHERIKQLQQGTHEPEERKHVEEELRALHKIIIFYEGISQHEFCFGDEERELLLITNRVHREIVHRSLADKNSKVHPLGVLVRTKDLASVMQIRTFRELLFPIHTDGLLEEEPREAAQKLWASDLYELIRSLHKGEEHYYFRVECKNRLTLEERSLFAKRISAELERLSAGKLTNSPNDYEIEIRLIGNKDGKMYPALKCHRMPDERFCYRKNVIATSIHPSTAALIMELSAPYLKENAQIMDPFCGVGTMLIERNQRVAAREMYATDIYGDAITFGRENARLAGTRIQFIHRDFFDFKHDYLFEEIITNMPVRGKKTKEEMERLYERFFSKALEITTREAVIIMYCNEAGFVKKQLRLHKELHLLQETAMQSKGDYSLFIIGVLR